jgi:hypothetical protein
MVVTLTIAPWPRLAIAAGGVAPGQYHVGAEPGQGERRSPADAAVAAGDQGSGSGQIVGHVSGSP